MPGLAMVGIQVHGGPRIGQGRKKRRAAEQFEAHIGQVRKET